VPFLFSLGQKKTPKGILIESSVGPHFKIKKKPYCVQCRTAQKSKKKKVGPTLGHNFKGLCNKISVGCDFFAAVLRMKLYQVV
jgi:hypothetical protein